MAKSKDKSDSAISASSVSKSPLPAPKGLFGTYDKPSLAEKLIMDFEGFENGGEPYKCTAGYWTGPYGTREINGKEVTANTPRFSEEQGYYAMKTVMLKKVEIARQKFPNFDSIAPYQQAGMLSYVYNMKEGSIGEGIKRIVGEENWDKVADKLLEYKHGGSADLTPRREIEAALVKGDFATTITKHNNYKGENLTDYLQLSVQHSKDVLASIIADPIKKAELEKDIYESKGYNHKVHTLQKIVGIKADGNSGEVTKNAWNLVVAKGGVDDEVKTQALAFQSMPKEQRGVLAQTLSENVEKKVLPLPKNSAELALTQNPFLPEFGEEPSDPKTVPVQQTPIIAAEKLPPKEPTIFAKTETPAVAMMETKKEEIAKAIVAQPVEKEVAALFAKFNPEEGNPVIVKKTPHELNGIQKEAAIFVQVALNELGFTKIPKGELGHVAGGKTDAGIRSAQKEFGLENDGVAGKDTYDALQARIGKDPKLSAAIIAAAGEIIAEDNKIRQLAENFKANPNIAKNNSAKNPFRELPTPLTQADQGVGV